MEANILPSDVVHAWEMDARAHEGVMLHIPLSAATMELPEQCRFFSAPRRRTPATNSGPFGNCRL